MFDLVIFAGREQADNLERPVLGVPLVERVARRLTRNGAERIVLVGDMEGSRLMSLSTLAASSGAMSMSRDLPDFRLVPPKSGTVVFWEGDVIADHELVKSLISQAVQQGSPVFATANGNGNHAAPVAVALPAEALPTLDSTRNISNVSELIDHLHKSGQTAYALENQNNAFVLQAQTQKSIRDMENALLNELRKPMEVDGFLGALVYRIFSLPISRFISAFPITPNHVTAVALILGLCGAGAMASGTELGFLLGAMLLQLGAVIDFVDGEIARLKYLGSLDGAWFDTVSDDIVNNTFILGAGIGLARYHEAAWPVLISILAVMVIIPGLSYLYRGLLEQGSGDLCDFHWASDQGKESTATGRLARVGNAVKYLVKRDVYVSLFLVSVLVGVPEFIPVAGLIGALGFSVTVAKEAQFRRLNPTQHKRGHVQKTQSQPAA